MEEKLKNRIIIKNCNLYIESVPGSKYFCIEVPVKYTEIEQKDIEDVLKNSNYKLSKINNAFETGEARNEKKKLKTIYVLEKRVI